MSQQSGGQRGQASQVDSSSAPPGENILWRYRVTVASRVGALMPK